MFYRSIAQVMRLTPVMETVGAMSVSWAPVTDILDPFLEIPGQLACRLDLQFTRPGKDQPMPLAAGRAPDRIGILFCDLVTDPVSGLPLVLSGDRFTMISGPVFGTFEVRVIPEAALDLLGAHHYEFQVLETSQALQPGSPTPFPGSPA